MQSLDLVVYERYVPMKATRAMHFQLHGIPCKRSQSLEAAEFFEVSRGPARQLPGHLVGCLGSWCFLFVLLMAFLGTSCFHVIICFRCVCFQTSSLRHWPSPFTLRFKILYLFTEKSSARWSQSVQAPFKFLSQLLAAVGQRHSRRLFLFGGAGVLHGSGADD